MHCVFVDLEKAYGRVLKKGGAVVLHEEDQRGRKVCEVGAKIVIVMRCAVGVTDRFKVDIGIYL